MNSKNTDKSGPSKLITVTGEISCDDVDIISPHEHVLIDIRNQFTGFEEITLRKQSEQKVTIEKLGALSRNPYALRDNLVMDDEELAEQELMNFKKRREGYVYVDYNKIIRNYKKEGKVMLM